jgi:NADPH:quinone reductase-like Zn-dependent oxidoreductase/thioesterase domain-containing protein/aryl carrier-like protein
MNLPQDPTHGRFAEWPNFSVTVDKPGMLDSLRLVPAPRRLPGHGEVEIEVHSVALNFKEVLFALGVLPMPDGGPGFGLECAGIVSEVGPEVVGIEPGMEVIAVGSSCLAAFVIVHSSEVVAKPAHLAWEQAAGLSIAFLTAYYSLHRLGQLRRNESVLIHAATGGVGLAAIQVAQWLSAEIFATAGSTRKREYLQRLGIPHIFDSRTLAFGDEILGRTGQQGVDVVLNSLAGPFIPKSLSVLAPFGRFLEIGRRDVFANTPIPLGLLEKGIGFFVVNLSSRTPGFQQMFSEVMTHIEEGTFRPLPCQFFSLRRLEDAFDLLARAQHIGKVVINLPRRNAAVSMDTLAPVVLLPESDAPAAKPLLAEGLLNAEGVDVFRRVLAGHTSQIVVSTRSLESRTSEGEVVVQRAQDEAPPASRPSHTRPESASAYVPPRNDLEGTICGIWEKFFRIKLIGIHDNFFDIGGDSLLAVQLVARLREAVGLDLSPHSLLETPTIAGLAEVISRGKAALAQQQAQVAELPSCVVRIKGGDPARPLFLIHPAGGHVYNYLALSHTLSIPHEIFGIKSEPIDRQIPPLTTLEEMATYYSQQIIKVQPRGPYVLGGASFGGALAYEMAQQLFAAGHKVALVFLIDTGNTETMPKEEIEDAEVMAYLLRLAVDIPDSLDDLKQLLPDEQLLYFLERGKKANKLFPTVTLEEARQILQQSRINMRAMTSYKPGAYPGKLAFFQAMEQSEQKQNTLDPVWPKLARGGGVIVPVPGNHITMNFIPHVQLLGDKLSQLISEAMATGDGGGKGPASKPPL